MPLDALRRFINHPAPGLVFAAHEHAAAPERAHATPHEAGSPPSAEQLRTLDQLTSDNPKAFRALREWYTAHNGAALCILWDQHTQEQTAALGLLPIELWHEATKPWCTGGEFAELTESCPLYTAGHWRVIGTLASEGLSLVMFFGGTYEGIPLAGRMTCVGLDPALDVEDVLAENFEEFIDDFTTDPAEFFERVGFTWGVTTDKGSFSDPVAEYVSDIRNHPGLKPWPGQ